MSTTKPLIILGTCAALLAPASLAGAAGTSNLPTETVCKGASFKVVNGNASGDEAKKVTVRDLATKKLSCKKGKSLAKKFHAEQLGNNGKVKIDGYTCRFMGKGGMFDKTGATIKCVKGSASVSWNAKA